MSNYCSPLSATEASLSPKRLHKSPKAHSSPLLSHMEKTPEKVTSPPHNHSLPHFDTEFINNADETTAGEISDEFLSLSASKIISAVRVRPFLKTQGENQKECCTRIRGKTIYLTKKETERLFFLDHAFWSGNKRDRHYADNAQVYDVLKPYLLDVAFSGCNSACIGFGESASGKSYSLIGTKHDPGIMRRIISDAIERSNQVENQKITIHLACMELQNNHLVDLVSPSRTPLRLKYDRTSKKVNIENLTRIPLNSEKEALIILERALESRSKSTQNNNLKAHTIFKLYITSISPVDRTKKSACITIADLAGSETWNQKNFDPHEGTEINKSLCALMTVIHMIHNREMSSPLAKQKKKSFVPFRESKLTFLLQDNFQGASKTVILGTVSPAASHYFETLCTLKFIAKTNCIQQKLAVNEDKDQTRLIQALRHEIKFLREQLNQKNELILELRGIIHDYYASES